MVNKHSNSKQSKKSTLGEISSLVIRNSMFFHCDIQLDFLSVLGKIGHSDMIVNLSLSHSPQ